jgi:four helix bundle protein
MKFDLEERTLEFSKNAIDSVKRVYVSPAARIIIEQFVASATSVGANYSESCDAESTNDFIHKIGICKKEARETKYWIKLLVHLYPEMKNIFDKLDVEVSELILIFAATIKTSRRKLQTGKK